MLFRQFLQRVLRLLADHDQLALERVLIGAIISASDKALPHDRHGIEDRLAQTGGVGWHITPANQMLAFLGDEFFELSGDEITRSRLLRHETHGDRIIACRRQMQSFAVGPLAVKLVRYLDQNARAITKQGIGAHRAAVIEIGENFQRL